MSRGFAWFDAGTVESLNETSQFIKSIENRMGQKIGCIEEIALHNKWIGKKQIKKLAKKYQNTEYGKYLINLTI